MKGWRGLLVAGLGAISLIGAATSSAAADEGGTLLNFDTMTPVTGGAVGTVNDRGLTGGGIAWAITSGTGSVDHRGNVHVQVTGLVLAPTGVNPIGQFKAIVSCLTPHGIVNVSTGLFAASVPTGNSTMDDTVALPHPCKSPIVFVTNAAGRWFAMSNANPKEDDEDGD